MPYNQCTLYRNISHSDYKILRITEIEKKGHRVVFLQDERSTLPIWYDEVEGVICNGLFVYHPDVLVLALPLTEKTKHLINKSHIIVL